MSVSADYLTYVTDQLAGIGRVVARRMFGGVGLYADDLFFALIADDVLYFKVDDSNRRDYVEKACGPFRPFGDDADTYSMSYFEVPPDVLEDVDELATWARRALKVAATAALAKRQVTKKRSNKGGSRTDA